MGTDQVDATLLNIGAEDVAVSPPAEGADVFPEHKASREPVAQRIVVTLEACASRQGAMTIVELVEATGLAKTTVHRMCWKLVELGLLEHSSRGFCVGSKVFALAATNPRISQLRVAAIPHLVELQRRTGAMVNLATLSGGRALIIDALFTERSSRLPKLVGHALPLHCTGAGKAIAAALDLEERERLLFGGGPLPSVAKSTIVQPGLLRRHLQRVAETGIAVADGEFLPGVKALAAGFRLRDGGAVAIGVVEAWNSQTLRAAPAAVADAAAALRRVLN
ncbi:MAG TPA: IclR family transcriptional regulator [Amycolatopsis sp.]|uniref:IclR family transcriptional regulator n=1 Tax=Amycolatopsis sp. TaxID=37632 RepID=UPI002B469BDA|nr:IclR family transcriptional regulator [Amycolatopsis sp.]HKS45845.1 IclR family transcriptional regulator [Amycolatopsis sp.]